MNSNNKICILDWSTVSTGDISPDIFGRFGEVKCLPLCSDEKAAEEIADSNMVLCNKVPITRDVMEECKNLKYIGLFATGYNNIDLEAAKEHGITLCNAGEYSTFGVAQQTFSYILHFANKTHVYDDFVKKGNWEKSETFSAFPFATCELLDKTISVIGFGSIGRRVAAIGAAFGMKVLVNTRTQPKDCPYELVSLERALTEGDFVTFHCPLTEQTKNIINRENLSLMKKTAVLINTARGGLTDEKALADALNSGQIAASYMDVLQTEPMSPDTPLKNAKNCVITPHCAWSSLETRQRLTNIAAETIRSFLEGRAANVIVG